MRALLSVALLAVGVAIGGGVPSVTHLVHDAVGAIGLGPKQGEALPDAATREAGHAHGPGEAHSEGGKADAAGGEPRAEENEGLIRMSPEQAAAQDIVVARLDGGALARHLLVSGSITQDSDRIARVPARVVGTVSEMRKRLGEAVAKGEVVAILDSREVADAKSEYLTAAVKAELETTNFERQQALWDKRISAESAFLSARAAHAEAILRQDLARQKLSALGLSAGEVARLAKKDETTPNASTLRQYELRSPIAGRIVERKVDVGAAVGKEGEPTDVYTVADLSSVWIELSVPTTEIAQVREGARVVIAPALGASAPEASRPDEDGRRAEGRVVFVSPILNPDTRSARVIVSLPNPDMAWRPGAFVTTEVEIARDVVRVLAPKSAIQTIAGETVVFVRAPDGFQRRDVRIGKADDDAFEIVSGLEPGVEVAVGNSFVLKAELGKADADHAH